MDSLPRKIRSGGSGVWGTVNMPAHPSISLNDARTIVQLYSQQQPENDSNTALKGNFTHQRFLQMTMEKEIWSSAQLIRTRVPKDRRPLTTEEIKVLRSQQLSPGCADVVKNAEIDCKLMFAVSTNIVPKSNGFIGFRKIDLSGIQQLVNLVHGFPQAGICWRSDRNQVRQTRWRFAGPG